MVKRLTDSFVVTYLILSTGAIILGNNETYIVLPFTLLMLFLNILNKRNLNRAGTVFLIYLIGIVLLSVFRNGFFSSNYGVNFNFGFGAKLLNAFLVANYMSFSSFRYMYIKQVYIISVVSLGFYISFFLMPELLQLLPSIPIEDIHQKNFLFYVYEAPRFVFLPRNMSLFYEPGVFQGIILLAIVLNGGLFERYLSRWRSILLIAVIFSTFSTTGYLALFFLMLLKRESRLILVSTLAGFIFIFSDVIGAVFVEMWDKIGNVTGNVSGQRRLTDILLEIQMSLNRPLLGYAFDYFQVKGDLLKGAGVVEKWSGSTNSIFYQLALYGYLFVLPLLWAIWSLISRLWTSNVHVFLVVLAMMIFMNGETFLQKQLFMLIVFFGIMTQNKTSEIG
jgi:hypothetical protein